MTESAQTQSLSQAVKERQPAALRYLFFAELWERFSFYGMKALLVLYMTRQLMFNDSYSYGVFGAYGALLYGSSIVGGYLADHFLGNRRAILTGSVLIILGHLTLALPIKESFFYGLAFLVVGTGFFKPNVTSFLGMFYKKDDPRRDSGFTLFYVGINIGGLISPLICGYVGEVFGWHYGFGIAAIGMVCGALVFRNGYKHFGDVGLPPEPEILDKSILLGLSINQIIILGALLFVPLTAYLIQNNGNLEHFLNVVAVVVFGGLAVLAFKSTPDERRCIFTLLLMYFFTACFFAIFEQAGGSLLLFSERNIDRVFFGFTVPSAWSQSINALFVVLLGPLFSTLWIFLAKRKLEPSTPFKFVMGFSAAAIGFYLFILGCKSADAASMVSYWWLVAGFGMVTVGELLISPVGLSMVTKLAPARFMSMMMGAYFVSMGLANFVAAKIAQIMGAPSGEVDVRADPAASLASFENIFSFITEFSVCVAVLSLVTVPLIRRTFKDHG